MAGYSPSLACVADDYLDTRLTERRNPRSTAIDTASALEIVDLIGAEDATVPGAVARARVHLAKAIDLAEAAFRAGGRLVYIGAGTSGRLGVLDAAECPPTFQTPPGQVVGLIAGGPGAMFQAVEGAEDDPALAVQDLATIKLSANDVLLGIATSGRTPYVLGGLRHARAVGAFAV